MFQDRRSVSWPACFLWQRFIGRPVRIERLEAHDGAPKIEDHAKVPKEISTQDPTLLKPRRLVDRIEVEHRGADLFPRVTTHEHLGQQGNLYVFGNTSGPENTHSMLLNESS